MELARSCCRPKLPPWICSILRSFIDLWVKFLYRNKTAGSESNPVQSSRSKSMTCPRKGVCSDSNQTAQRLQMAARKSLETMSGVIPNRLQPKFAAKLVAHEMLPVQGQGVCSQHSNFRWCRAEALKRCLAWFWIDCVRLCCALSTQGEQLLPKTPKCPTNNPKGR